jgi:ParB family chromosome partitioning protein
MGHARALLGLDTPAAQRQLAREIVAKGLSVRETEALVKRQATPPVEKAAKPRDPNTRAAEAKLRLALGTNVEIVRKGKGGRIEITFANEDELNRLFEQITEP